MEKKPGTIKKQILLKKFFWKNDGPKLYDRINTEKTYFWKTGAIRNSAQKQ